MFKVIYLADSGAVLLVYTADRWSFQNQRLQVYENTDKTKQNNLKYKPVIQLSCYKQVISWLNMLRENKLPRLK